MTKLTNPVPVFIDARGALIDAGKIYVGVANDDPETNPIDLFSDADLTIPLDQPLRTQGGVIVENGAQVFVFFAEDDFSLRVRDADDNLVSFVSSAVGEAGEGPLYQPLDSDLTAIAALATTEFGRSLLTLANQAALKTATGFPNPLPLTGGTMTGNIQRSGAGPHLYLADAALTSGRVFVTAAGAGDPTSLPGDIWLEKASA